MTCPYCDIIKDIEAVKLYEDDLATAILHKTPVTAGHILLMPKEHFTILEQVPDDIVKHLSFLCNKLVNALIHSLKVEGANILIDNGVAAGQEMPHFAINIIPRRSNDGLSFEWQPRQISENDMNLAEKQLKAHTEHREKETKAEKKEEGIKKVKAEGEENYLIKQLEREA